MMVPDEIEREIESLKEMEKYQIKELPIRDRIEYYKTSIYRDEVTLRENTDQVLRSDKAMELVLENQRYFAQYQDKIAFQAKK